MTQSFLEREIARIIEAAAEFPGMSSIRLFTRRMPGFGPAAREGFYEQRAVSVEPAEARRLAPGRLPVCRDADDVVITFQGSIGWPGALEELRSAVNQLPVRLNFGTRWDVRLEFRGTSAESQQFEVRVFKR